MFLLTSESKVLGGSEYVLTYLSVYENLLMNARHIANSRINLLQLYAEPSTVRWMRDNLPIDECIIVSPDAGGAKRYVGQRSTLAVFG